MYIYSDVVCVTLCNSHVDVAGEPNTPPPPPPADLADVPTGEHISDDVTAAEPTATQLRANLNVLLGKNPMSPHKGESARPGSIVAVEQTDAGTNGYSKSSNSNNSTSTPSSNSNDSTIAPSGTSRDSDNASNPTIHSSTGNAIGDRAKTSDFDAIASSVATLKRNVRAKGPLGQRRPSRSALVRHSSKGTVDEQPPRGMCGHMRFVCLPFAHNLSWMRCSRNLLLCH